MSVRVSWAPNDDSTASYNLERAVGAGGPWSLLVSIPHVIPGPDWDAEAEGFFYVDATGTGASYYRLIAVDQSNSVSPPSSPFRPAADPLSAPTLINTLYITVGNAATLLNLGFTTIEIWETEDSGGNWTEVTSASATAALVESVAASTNYRVAGLGFSFRLNRGPTQTVTFPPTPASLPADAVAARINLVQPGFATSLAGRIRLRSPTSGRASAIEILACSAAELGFPIGTAYGTDKRLELAEVVAVYPFYDVAGTSLTRYRWRFSANGQDPVSHFSAMTASTALLDPAALSIGIARFVGMDGSPVRRKVVVTMDNSPSPIGAYTTGDDQPLVVEADETGFLQVPLMRGISVKVAIEGTAVVRQLTVPSTPTFDLFATVAEIPDRFSVQAPPARLTRRTVS